MFFLPSLLIVCSLASHFDIDKGIQAARDREYEYALSLLSAINHPPPEKYNDYYFWRAVCEQQLRKKDAALKSIDVLLHSFYPVPRRYEEVAWMMQNDLTTWKEDVNIESIGRKMSGVVRRLDLVKADDQTKAEQKEVLDDLDKLIKEKEDEANKKMEQAKAQAEQTKKAAQQSELPTGNSSEGKLDEKELMEYAKVWGTLPDAERIKIAQKFTAEAPAKYRPYVEAYFKALNQK